MHDLTPEEIQQAREFAHRVTASTHGRGDSQEALRQLARVVPALTEQLASAERRYETAFEGREHAWNQLEDILDAFGANTESVDISAVAAYVRMQLQALTEQLQRLGYPPETYGMTKDEVRRYLIEQQPEPLSLAEFHATMWRTWESRKGHFGDVVTTIYDSYIITRKPEDTDV